MDAGDIGGIIIAVVSLAAFYMLFRNFAGLVRLFMHSITPLSKAEKTILETHSPFYRSLRPAGKKEFSKRVKEVIYDKEWIGRGIAITQEMKVRVAATLTQLTFGLERALLVHFKKVFIFPEEYFVRSSGQWHQGDVRPGQRSIVLSWKHFEQGQADPHDGRDLGLHELAHALWLEDRIENKEHRLLDPVTLKEWRTLAGHEMARIRNGEERPFRKYAAVNEAEFFAVAVEQFFERPREVARELPELHRCMTRLLKQDPARAN